MDPRILRFLLIFSVFMVSLAIIIIRSSTPPRPADPPADADAPASIELAPSPFTPERLRRVAAPEGGRP